MNPIRTLTHSCTALLALIGVSLSGEAEARDYRHGGSSVSIHYSSNQGYAPQPVYYAPRPVYYAPPVYAPRPHFRRPHHAHRSYGNPRLAYGVISHSSGPYYSQPRPCARSYGYGY